MGHRTTAQAAAVTFVLYLRPSETLGLTHAYLAPPSKLGGAATRHWCVNLHPEELGVPSKTGEFDCSLVVDSAEFTFLANLFTDLLVGIDNHIRPARRVFR